MEGVEISLLLIPEGRSGPEEASHLRELVPVIRRVMDGCGVRWEVVVVSGGEGEEGEGGEGGGGDELRSAAEAEGARVVVEEGAYGDRFRRGVAECSGEHIITMDTDYSHPPALLRAMVESRARADVIIASRYIAGAAADMGFFRKTFSRMLNRLFRWVLDMPVRDLSSGFRMYSRRALDEIELEGASYDVLIESLLRIKAAGFLIEEIPFHYRSRSGLAKLRARRSARSYLRTFRRMRQLRNSWSACDYDDRAFDSIIPLQRYWQRKRYREITGFSDPSKLTLDIGCGSSRIARSMPRLVGLDLNVKPLRYLRRQGVLAVSGDLTQLPFRDGEFPQVICSEVIEHLPAERMDFDELARVIEPGGTLVIGTPNYAKWMWRLLEKIYNIVLPQAHGTGHVSQYTHVTLKQKLAAVGIDVVARGGVFFGCQLVFKCVKRDGDGETEKEG